MCVGVPCRLIKVDGDVGEVEVGGTVWRVGLHLIENPRVGQYVILHAGFAIQLLDEEEAKESLALLEKLVVEENNAIR